MSQSIRFVLVLTLLLSPAARARAQVSNGPGPAAPSSPTPQPSIPARTPPAEEVFAHDEIPPLPSDRLPFAHQGVLIEKLDGRVVREVAADQAFNPASAIKLLTALVALRTFGPRHRFSTTLWVTGTFDKATGTVTGDLVVSGRDPSFHDEHAVAVARELNQLGVRIVTGDLIVAPKFTLNFSPSAQRSGERFYDTLDATRRPAAASRAWAETRAALNETEVLSAIPSVAVMGAVYVGAAPIGARVVSTHQSPPLTDVLKALLCYSNNFLAERLGDALGGAQGLERYLSAELKIPAHEFRLASASGLGINRLTPRHMMAVYRALLDELHGHRLKAADILPVAGVDPGTLKRRYENSLGRGSVIAKTGTLGRTDGGASALVGQMRARSGETLLFVVFNLRGSVTRFRAQQDALVSLVQGERGGPLPFTYQPNALAMRLSASAFDNKQAAGLDEFEPSAADQ